MPLSSKQKGTDDAGTYHGQSISSGKVYAKICVFSINRQQRIVERNLATKKACKIEIKRFDQAREKCTHELENIIRKVRDEIGATEAEIFIAQKHIMNDPMIIDEITKTVLTQKKNIEFIITQVLTGFEEKFKHIDNEYLGERASDIGEIRRRLIDALLETEPGFACEGQVHCKKGEGRVIVAESLSASMVVNLNLNRVQGIVTEHGGGTSHAAIIARSVGIPSVSGIKGIYKRVSCGDSIIVDGDQGKVIHKPKKKLVLSFLKEQEQNRVKLGALTSPPNMSVMANAGLIEDVKYAAKIRADGIGLFRTELSFLLAGKLLAEDEQFTIYRNIQSYMTDKPVVFRLLDIGGDKDLPFLNIEKESNPFMGLRGARFLLENRDVFSSQVRALGKLSKHGVVRILFPMIIDSVQLEKLIAGVREIMVGVDSVLDNIKLGAMFEVPGACMQALSILKQVDFASIGSNDLIQYLFAVDRNNEAVSQDYNPEHPVLWSVLQTLSQSAKELHKPLSLCGEMAGMQGIPSRLIDIGIKSVSVSPRLVQRVRLEMNEYTHKNT